MAVKTETIHQAARVPLKSAVLSLAAVVVLATSAVAQGEAESPAPEPRSNRISVRIAEAMGNDPETIFRFVADDVRYEPYSGLLRGDAGTFYSRAGNSVDQAVLLTRLLGAADIETRYAVGAIDDEVADELLASGAVDAESLRRQNAEAYFGRIEGLSEEPPEFPHAQAYVPMYEGEATVDEIDAWVADELGKGLATIEAALEDSGLAVASDFTPMPGDEVSLHTWVQASIDDEWIDLDPSLPSLAYGATIGEASETMESIAEDRVHTVAIHVVSERVVDGSPKQEILLELDWPAHEIAGEPIVIANLGPDSAPELTQAFEAVLGIESFHPVVATADQSVAGGRMQFKGVEDGGGLGGGFFDVGEAVEETTAEWVEVTVSSPGREPVTERRALFDRIGQAAREAGSFDVDALEPLASVDIDGDGSEELAPMHSAMWLNVSTGLPSLRSGVLELEDTETQAMSMLPFAHHVLNAIGGLDAATPLGARPFADAPNVTAYAASVVARPDGGLGLDGAMDILHRGHGVARVPGAGASSMPGAVPGVLSHVTERLLAGDATGATDEFFSVSVGRLFDAAAAQGIPTRTVTSRDEMSDLPFGPDALSHLGESIDRGWVAIVPTLPVNVDDRERVGWWLFDPSTGQVRDQMDNGRGQTLTEKIVMGVFIAVVGIGIAILAYGVVKDIWDPMVAKFKQDKGLLDF